MVKRVANTSGSGLIILTIFLVVLAIVCMVFDRRGKVPLIRDTVQQYFSLPIKQASDWPQEISDSIRLYFSSHSALKAENERLKREVVWLKANLANQTVLEAEYRRLKQLFESTATRTRPVIIAEVLDSQIDASKHHIEINKGRNAEVFDGQIVIDENGVVGQVTAVTQDAATVSLITDERQLIPVFVERNRLRMIARGSGDLSDLEMEFVNKSADVRVGDKIVTSGLGKRYPRGYGIGIVTEVDSSPANEFLRIHASPLASLDKVLEVLLIQDVAPVYTDDSVLSDLEESDNESDRTTNDQQ